MVMRSQPLSLHLRRPDIIPYGTAIWRDSEREFLSLAALLSATVATRGLARCIATTRAITAWDITDTCNRSWLRGWELDRGESIEAIQRSYQG